MAGTNAMNRSRVVVTGGSGFIGRAVVSALRDRGNPVTVVDREPINVDDDGVTNIHGDLADEDILDAAVSPDTGGIVHLAARTSVLRSVEAPQQTFADNVAVTQGLLERARARGVPRFILASTNAVVGDVGTATITADMPLRPLTPYGATKAACEMLLSGYAGAYGMTCCALRFTNVYGPGMSGKDSFVPRLMRAALSGEGVRVYGDGLQRRDLVNLDDVVRGILLSWDAEHTGTAVLGSGRSISVLELIDTVREVTDAPLPVEHVAAPEGEMPAVVVDVSSSTETIGYRPSVELAQGLAEVWRYFRDHDTRTVPR